jgi:serine/threonine-protein kinase
VPGSVSSRSSDLLLTLRGGVPTRYVVDREIGRGGMAAVFLARDTKHDRPVAIKVLRPELGASLGAERFLFEIRVAARLQHPHILPLYDSGEADGLLFYVMPYVEGESLRDLLLREGRLPVPDAARITIDVAQALHYAHAVGIVHRDIKPENILLSQGYAVVTDFGVARAIEAAGSDMLTQPGVAVGTPTYMSPEQMSGEAVDGRSDLYALGCVLFEMLVGHPPFTAPTPLAVLARHLTKPVPDVATLVPGLPPSLDLLLRRSLAKNAGERFSTGAALAEALEGLRGGPAAAPVIRPAAPPEHSIAVLPFANVSADAEDEYFSDGLAEEVMSALARVPRLRVAARTSSFAFKGAAADVREIGRKLSVESVLEGSVRRVGRQVRIGAQLVNATDGYQLWSGTYRREVADIFTLQDEITEAIVGALRLELLGGGPGGRPRPTEDVAAYERYLRGRFEWNRRTPQALAAAVEHLQAAVERAPDFALAHAGLADAWLTLGIYGARPPAAAFPEARAAAQRALGIDPTLAEAHTALACIHAVHEWNWAAAEERFERATAIDPRYPTAHHWYALNCLAPQARAGAAAAAVGRARALDPLSPVVVSGVGVQRYFARAYEEAIAAQRDALALDDRFGMAHFFLGQALAAQGRFTDAIAAFEQARALVGDTVEVLAALGHAHGRAGHRDAARRMHRDLLGLADRAYVSPTLLAQVVLGLDDAEAALGHLETACTVRAADLIWIGVRPVFDPLRDAPRFQGLLRRLRLA